MRVVWPASYTGVFDQVAAAAAPGDTIARWYITTIGAIGNWRSSVSCGPASRSTQFREKVRSHFLRSKSGRVCANTNVLLSRLNVSSAAVVVGNWSQKYEHLKIVCYTCPTRQGLIIRATGHHVGAVGKVVRSIDLVANTSNIPYGYL